jgi:serine/threonine protein kinase
MNMVQPGARPMQLDRYTLFQWVDAVADRFEAEWQSGQPPCIADYLHDIVGAKRSLLLRELVKIDLERRLRAGETRRWEEYLRDFPELQHSEEEGDSVSTPSAATNLAPLDSGSIPPSLMRARTAKWPIIAGYELLTELGHGGMGSVYKARQQSLKRIVALKVIRAAIQTDPRYLFRFRIEAEATARLQHPNIAQIFEVGQQGDVPYLAMEYVDGGPLSERLAGKPLPARQAAEMIVTLARAMQYAHEHGVIHRDLKPDNILLSTPTQGSDAQEVSSPSSLAPGTSHTLKITDFGLAKFLEDDTGASVSGTIVGTPNYMAPEQAEGRTQEIGPGTDIYALGAILYELLTGGPPFKGASVLETLEQVRIGDLVPPSRLVAKVSRDLETICLKSLARAPAARYACAGALGDDLDRFLKGEPIRARPVGMAGHAWRWCRRHPTQAGLGATACALLLTIIVASVLVALSSRAQERSQRREALIQQMQLV